ncbi:ABC transporter substrate-binding protein [Pseudomonadales bacterium]|nr:ABC transporter substrate-binding protein [Pseudomonadales bacterium]
MTINSLNNPYDGDASLKHNQRCECAVCAAQKQSPIMLSDAERTRLMEQQADQMQVSSVTDTTHKKQFDSSEDMLDQAVENAIVRGIFGHNDMHRRTFMKAVGGGTMASVLGTMLPMDSIKAAVKESAGQLEKTKLKVGFVPITCATPIIMAHPLGFYEKYGLDVEVIKTAGWAVARDKSLNKEYDASHMLTPMPLAMTMGAGSSAKPYIMPAVENINGQAIVLANKHKDKRDPKQWKGFKFGVPFEYSMHNFLLRYYVAEFGIDPDKDIQIRVVPPPEMVANLRAGNLDGYLSPDPFNQRAVWEKIGFLHMLTKDIWEGHPCCAFACSQEFAVTNPNTYSALLKSIVDATQFSSDPANRPTFCSCLN